MPCDQRQTLQATRLMYDLLRFPLASAKRMSHTEWEQLLARERAQPVNKTEPTRGRPLPTRMLARRLSPGPRHAYG